MEVLRQRGYATYAAGKMHFGPQWRFPPDGRPLSEPGPNLAINPQPEAWDLPWYGFEQVWITEGVMRTRAQLTYAISRAELAQLAIEVPADQKVAEGVDYLPRGPRTGMAFEKNDTG